MSISSIFVSLVLSLFLASCSADARHTDAAHLAIGDTIYLRGSEAIGSVEDGFVNGARVMVLDGIQGNLKLYSLEGEFLKAIGRPGDGPGEFRAPIAMDILPDDAIVVLQAGNPGLSLFDSTGAFLQRFPVIGGFFGGLGHTGDGGIMMAHRSINTEEPSTSRAVHIYGRAGQKVHSLVAEISPSRFHEGNVAVTRAAINDDRILVAWQQTNHARLVSTSDELVRPLTLGEGVYVPVDWPDRLFATREALSEWMDRQNWITRVEAWDRGFVVEMSRYTDGSFRRWYEVLDLDGERCALIEPTNARLVGFADDLFWFAGTNATGADYLVSTTLPPTVPPTCSAVRSVSHNR